MKIRNLKIREGDTTEITCSVPPEFIGGELRLMIELNEISGIIKTETAAEETTFTLSENDTVTRVGKYPYEIRAKNGSEALVLVQGVINIQDSIIVRTDLIPSPPVAIIAGGGGGGAQGPPGVDGKSAYQIAVDNGFSGTEQEWLNSLEGAQGPTGLTGPPGPKGDDGLRGEKGDTGDTGDTGPAGPSGPQGETGEQGQAGPIGPKGDTGDTGPEGPQGPKGDTGDAGPQGPPGTGGAPVGFYATCEGNTNKTPSGANWAIVNPDVWNKKVWDSGNTFDMAIGCFTAPEDGLYFLQGLLTIGHTTATDGRVICAFVVNPPGPNDPGTPGYNGLFGRGTIPNNNWGGFAGTAECRLNAGDKVYMTMYNSAGGQIGSGFNGYVHFGVRKIMD